MVEKWLPIIVDLLEHCLQELNLKPKEAEDSIEALRGPALEVLNFALGNQKTPALLLSKYEPCWPPHFSTPIDPSSVVGGVVSTWVWHAVLTSVERPTDELKYFFKQPENQPRLRYLAVSPAHHYRLLLGIYWPEDKLLETHEKVEPRNILPTQFSLKEIQKLSKNIFETEVSTLAIRQHTYRMRIEILTMFYLLLGFNLSDITQRLSGAPKSIIRASFGRLHRIIGD